MPAEEIYRARVMPQAAAPMPLADANDFGAGVGQALGQAGEQLHGERVRAYQIERRVQADREAADFSHRYALHRQNMDDVVREIRANPTSPDYAEHLKRVQEADEAGRATLLDGITEGAVRRQAEQQLDSYRTQLDNAEGEFVQGQQIAKTVLDRGQANDISQNRIRRGMDPQAYGQELELNHAQIYSLNGLTPVQKDKLWADYQQGAGIAFLNHAIDTNPKAVPALLDSGAFDEVLTPQQVEQLRNGAAVEIRRQDAAVAHQANVADQQAKDALSAAKTDAGQGIDVSARLPALAQHFTAKQDQSAIAEIQKLNRDSAFAKVWEGRTPLEREARVGALNGIAADKRTADQQAELHWLNEKRGGLDGQFAADRVGYVMAHGQPGEQPPALDPENPASFAARAQWARTAARTYGQMDLLSKQERQDLAGQLTRNDAGYDQVTNALAEFGGSAAQQAAKEVAPSDSYLQQLVILPDTVRQIAKNGRDALRLNPKLVPAETSENAEAGVVAYSRGFERALMAVPQAKRNAIRDVARNIAAKFLHDNPGEELNDAVWSRSITMALGGHGNGRNQVGGLGSWNDMKFLVPENMTAQQFTDRVFGFIKAHPDNVPINPDGTPASIRNARPVFVAPGQYQFFVGDRPLRARGRDGSIGGPWQFTIGGGR